MQKIIAEHRDELRCLSDIAGVSESFRQVQGARSFTDKGSPPTAGEGEAIALTDQEVHIDRQVGHDSL